MSIEIVTATVNDVDTNATLDFNNILDKMQKAYEGMTEVMLSAVYGDADREYRPAFFMGTNAYQNYQIAIAELHTTTPSSTGCTPPSLSSRVLTICMLAKKPKLSPSWSPPLVAPSSWVFSDSSTTLVLTSALLLSGSSSSVTGQLLA